MRRTPLVVSALSVLALSLVTGSQALAAGPQTTVSLNLMNAAETAPMASAHVVVFLVRPAAGLHDKVTLPQIASGQASSSGSVSMTVSTAKIEPSDTGGSGKFNSLIIAWDQNGEYDVTDQIITEGNGLSLNLRALRDAAGRPALWPAAQVQALDSDFSKGDVPAEQTAIADTYRYSPITPLNSAPGLHAVLSYTYSTSVQRQSDFELPTDAGDVLGLTDNQIEQTDRSVSSGWTASKGEYHRWIWADYYFVEYAIAVVKGGWIQWEPDHFQGTVTDSNPNKAPKHKKAIGKLNFYVSRVNCGPGHNWCVKITSNSLPWSRSTGQDEENDLGANFTLGGIKGVIGPTLSLEDLTTYGSITSVTWSYEKGCPKGDTRIVYGYHNDPVAAGRVLAACAPNKDV